MLYRSADKDDNRWVPVQQATLQFAVTGALVNFAGSSVGNNASAYSPQFMGQRGIVQGAG
jgi:hypothetical protein